MNYISIRLLLQRNLFISGEIILGVLCKELGRAREVDS
ncbi:hypothetical protein FTV88_2352 [Heliorestis convoluta]|uniref:Uncharacterized protein n=1 Tax=Heliorestis convoluta TaxID=356322 RepID=A0A5Q2N878_9FIRM|nr:hypothetical protein FTV88_2352 [Heliorestis convoluta]